MVINANLVHKSFDKESVGAIKCELMPNQQQWKSYTGQSLKNWKSQSKPFLWRQHLECIFLIRKVKNTVLWAYVLEDLDGEEIVGTFYGKRIAEDKSNGL